MGWQRRNKTWYYYHTVYIKRHYVNIYCGGGTRGRLFEQFFKQARVDGQEARRLLAELRTLLTK